MTKEKQPGYLMVVIAILVISLITNLYFLFSRSSTTHSSSERSSTDSSATVVPLVKKLLPEPSSPLFKDVYPNSTALAYVKKYRPLKNSPGDTVGNVVLYDSIDIAKFMGTIYPHLTAQLDTPTYCKKCKIMVGFYFMKTKRKGNEKNTFFVIPTFVDTTENDKEKWRVYDFVDSNYVYLKPKNSSRTPPPPISYDAGQMYP